MNGPVVSHSPASGNAPYPKEDRKEPPPSLPAPAAERPATASPPTVPTPPLAIAARAAPPRSAPAAERPLQPVVSSKPKDRVPVPRLPRMQEVRSAEELARLFSQIENETVAQAGVTREFAQGVTAPLRRLLEARRQMVTYPVGVYYFIVSEAARGHDKQIAAQNLLTNHENEGIRKLSALPSRR
jgi:hypothetical protein